MRLLQKAQSLIDLSTINKVTVNFEDGDTNDIITTVLMGDEQAARRRTIKDFAPLLRGDNDYKTCVNIWNFIKNEIPYVADKSGLEKIRLPHQAIYDAYNIQNGGDCKSFALLSNDLCRELGINTLYRFIAQKRGSTKATHVYSVAIINGKEIILDAVYNRFNAEPYRTYKVDYRASLSLEKGGIKGLYTNYTEGASFQKWI